MRVGAHGKRGTASLGAEPPVESRAKPMVRSQGVLSPWASWSWKFF